MRDEYWFTFQALIFFNRKSPQTKKWWSGVREFTKQKSKHQPRSKQAEYGSSESLRDFDPTVYLISLVFVPLIITIDIIHIPEPKAK